MFYLYVLAVATSRYSNTELKKALRHDIDDLARQKALQVHHSPTHLRLLEAMLHENLGVYSMAVCTLTCYTFWGRLHASVEACRARQH